MAGRYDNPNPKWTISPQSWTKNLASTLIVKKLMPRENRNIKRYWPTQLSAFTLVCRIAVTVILPSSRRQGSCSYGQIRGKVSVFFYRVLLLQSNLCVQKTYDIWLAGTKALALCCGLKSPGVHLSSKGTKSRRLFQKQIFTKTQLDNRLHLTMFVPAVYTLLSFSTTTEQFLLP